MKRQFVNENLYAQFSCHEQPPERGGEFRAIEIIRQNLYKSASSKYTSIKGTLTKKLRIGIAQLLSQETRGGWEGAGAGGCFIRITNRN